jgi:sugar lactone lactonase YvrE
MIRNRLNLIVLMFFTLSITIRGCDYFPAGCDRAFNTAVVIGSTTTCGGATCTLDPCAATCDGTTCESFKFDAGTSTCTTYSDFGDGTCAGSSTPNVYYICIGETYTFTSTATPTPTRTPTSTATSSSSSTRTSTGTWSSATSSASPTIMTPVPSYDTAAPNNKAFGILTYGGTYVQHYVEAGKTRWYRIQVPSWPSSGGELTVTLQVQTSGLYATGPASIGVYAGQIMASPLSSVPASSVIPISSAGPGSPGTTLTVSLYQYSTQWEGPGGYYFIQVNATGPAAAYYLLSWDPMTQSVTSSYTLSSSQSSTFVPSLTQTRTQSSITSSATSTASFSLTSSQTSTRSQTPSQTASPVVSNINQITVVEIGYPATVYPSWYTYWSFTPLLTGPITVQLFCITPGLGSLYVSSTNFDTPPFYTTSNPPFSVTVTGSSMPNGDLYYSISTNDLLYVGTSGTYYFASTVQSGTSSGQCSVLVGYGNVPSLSPSWSQTQTSSVTGSKSLSSTATTTPSTSPTKTITPSNTNSPSQTRSSTATMTPTPTASQPFVGIISTVAGYGVGDGFAATDALLSHPQGISEDFAGNIYIADHDSNRIRKVGVDGVISTIAGTGLVGFYGDGGPATLATFNPVQAVSSDSSGNVFIADFYNCRVRKVNASGIIATVAGSACGFSGDGGPATLAKINGPQAIHVDSIGNLFITSSGMGCARMVDTNGIISTIAGNGSNAYYGDGGPATLASLSFNLLSIFADSSGNIFIADTDNHRIRKIDASGNISTVAGTGLGGYSGDFSPATASKLNGPRGVCVDAVGNIYIADRNNNRIRKVNTSGIITTVAGTGSYGFSGDGGPATSAMIFNPEAVFTDSTGSIYIADSGNGCVRRVNSSGIITTVAGNCRSGFLRDNAPATSVSINYPFGLQLDADGNIFFADSNNHRIMKVDARGIIRTIAGTGSWGYSGDGGPATSARLHGPSGVYVDSQGNIFISEYNGHRVRKVDGSGIIVTVVGTGSGAYSGDGGPASLAQINAPTDIYLDSWGTMYIADTNNQRVRVVDTNGTISTLAGSGAAGFSGDGGPATLATMYYPTGVYADTTGNVYTADQYNHRIRVIDSSGTISTIVGSGGAGYAGDGGPATSAKLNYPTDVYLDSQGNIFIADRHSNVIRKVDGNAVISTVAGSGAAASSGDGGHATSSMINYPTGVFVDSLSNIYITESYGNRIRKVSYISTLPTTSSTSTSSSTSSATSSLTSSSTATSSSSSTASTTSSSTMTFTSTSTSSITSSSSESSTPSITASGSTTSSPSSTASQTASPSSSITLSPTQSPTASMSPSSSVTRTVSPTQSSTSTVSPSATPSPQVYGLITTIAGNGLGDGGPATSALLFPPSGVCLDSAGNFYIADHNSNRVRMVDTNGIIHTVAGNGGNGFSGDGGPATLAMLNYPSSVQVDSSGNIFILDAWNGRIRRVSTDGIITTVVGAGGGGFSGDGGPATSAQINPWPSGSFYLDPLGNMYLADYNNHRVRKINASGIITTVAGVGTAGYSGDGRVSSYAQLSSPAGVYIDSSTGTMYIADSGNNRIRRVNSSGIITTFAGSGAAAFSGDGGPATSASLRNPLSIAMDSTGSIYIADTGNSFVRKVNSSGIISTVAGAVTNGYSGDGGPATSAMLFLPSCIVIDPTGNIFIADHNNNIIRVVNTSGIIYTVAGFAPEGRRSSGDGGAATSAILKSPTAIYADELGNTYIADGGFHRIRKVDPTGTISTVAGTGEIYFWGDGGPATSAVLSGPSGVFKDLVGNVFLVDCGNGRIRKVDTNGSISTIAGTGIQGFSGDGGPATSAMLSSPNGLFVDSQGSLYFSDTYNARVRKINASGTITTVAGSGSWSYGGDGGPATSASLNHPEAVHVDSLGNIFIADNYNHRIRKVNTSGFISTIAGGGIFGSLGDGGPATSASLAYPSGVSVDAVGNIYIVDTGNLRVRKVDTNGIISTITGTGSVGFSGDGGIASYAMLYPYGLSSVFVDSVGNVFISDSGNNRVRKISSGLSIPYIRDGDFENEVITNPSTQFIQVTTQALYSSWTFNPDSYMFASGRYSFSSGSYTWLNMLAASGLTFVGLQHVTSVSQDFSNVAFNQYVLSWYQNARADDSPNDLTILINGQVVHTAPSVPNSGVTSSSWVRVFSTPWSQTTSTLSLKLSTTNPLNSDGITYVDSISLIPLGNSFTKNPLFSPLYGYSLDGNIIRSTLLSNATSPYRPYACFLFCASVTGCSAWMVETQSSPSYSCYALSGSTTSSFNTTFASGFYSLPAASYSCVDHRTDGFSLACSNNLRIRQILFGSFGQPYGTCGTILAKSPCHQSATESIVAQTCLNQTSCSLKPFAGNLGDPCWAQAKYLSVRVYCGSDASPYAPTIPYSWANVSTSFMALKDGDFELERIPASGNPLVFNPTPSSSYWYFSPNTYIFKSGLLPLRLVRVRWNAGRRRQLHLHRAAVQCKREPKDNVRRRYVRAVVVHERPT